MRKHNLPFRADFTFLKCVAVAIAFSPVTGCYTYSRVSDMGSGATVRLETRRPGHDVAFLPYAGDTVHLPGVARMDGTVGRSDTGNMFIHPVTFQTFRPLSSDLKSIARGASKVSGPSAGVAIVPHAAIADGRFVLTTRRLSKTRTAFLAVGVGFVAAVAAAMVSLGSSEDEIVRCGFFIC